MDLYRGSIGTHVHVQKKGFPSDLREAGDPNDPAFDRPLVVGRISDGVVEVRDKETGVMVRHEVGKKGAPSHPVAPIRKQQEEIQVNELTGKERLKAVADLYNAGKTYAEIGQELSISTGTIGYYINTGLKTGLIEAKRGRSGVSSSKQSPDTQKLEVLDEDKSVSLRLESLYEAVQKLNERAKKIEDRLDAMEQQASRIGQVNPDSQPPTDLQALWKPFAEAFTAKIEEIESIREQMRDLGIAFGDYFPSVKSPNLAENGRKRGSDVA